MYLQILEKKILTKFANFPLSKFSCAQQYFRLKSKCCKCLMCTTFHNNAHNSCIPAWNEIYINELCIITLVKRFISYQQFVVALGDNPQAY